MHRRLLCIIKKNNYASGTDNYVYREISRLIKKKLKKKMDLCSLIFLNHEIIFKGNNCGSLACRGPKNILNLHVSNQW